WLWIAGSFVPIQLLKEPTNENLAERIAAGNLLLFLFNLLPAYPMDGGRILRSILAPRKPETETTRNLAMAGRRLTTALIVIGLLGRAALMRAMMSEGSDAYVSMAMDRNYLRVPPDADLSEVMPKLSSPGAAALVMDDEDRLLGLLTSENLSEFIMLRQIGQS